MTLILLLSAVSCGQKENVTETTAALATKAEEKEETVTGSDAQNKETVEAPSQKYVIGDLALDQTQGLEDLNLKEKAITELLCDADEAAAAFEQYGFSKEMKSVYTAEWFQTHRLAMIIMSSTVDFGFSVTSIDVSGKQIQVTVREDMPQAWFSLACFKGILIELDKEITDPDMTVIAEREVYDYFGIKQ